MFTWDQLLPSRPTCFDNYRFSRLVCESNRGIKYKAVPPHEQYDVMIMQIIFVSFQYKTKII